MYEAPAADSDAALMLLYRSSSLLHASCTPLTRLLHASCIDAVIWFGRIVGHQQQQPPTRLSHASYTPLTRLLHASHTPLTIVGHLLVIASQLSPPWLSHQSLLRACCPGPHVGMRVRTCCNMRNGLMHASYTPLTRLLQRARTCCNTRNGHTRNG
jgi:hypothetical protein